MRRPHVLILAATVALALSAAGASAATITPTARTGLGLSLPMATASAGGDVIPDATGKVTAVLRNGSGSAVVVTVKSYQANALPGTAKADFTLSVAAGAEGLIGPLDIPAFVNPATGNVELTYSAVTSLSVGAFTY